MLYLWEIILECWEQVSLVGIRNNIIISTCKKNNVKMHWWCRKTVDLIICWIVYISLFCFVLFLRYFFLNVIWLFSLHILICPISLLLKFLFTEVFCWHFICRTLVLYYLHVCIMKYFSDPLTGSGNKCSKVGPFFSSSDYCEYFIYY